MARTSTLKSSFHSSSPTPSTIRRSPCTATASSAAIGYVSDHAGAIEHVLRFGVAGETYNIPGRAELTNREVVRHLLDRLGKPWSLVRSVEDRPGHDHRYAMDGTKLGALGWVNRIPFEEGLTGTVTWFRDNAAWWRAAKSGDWTAYYDRQYGARLAGSTEA